MKNPLTTMRQHSADNRAAASDAEGDLPLAGYDRLDVKHVLKRLPDCTQVELAAIDEYERAHDDRVDILNKLRYLRGPEPVEGYDALGEEEVTANFEKADDATLKRVREYELKFRRRDVVLRALRSARHNIATRNGVA
jgi:hypothetical protein